MNMIALSCYVLLKQMIVIDSNLYELVIINNGHP